MERVKMTAEERMAAIRRQQSAYYQRNKAVIDERTRQRRARVRAERVAAGDVGGVIQAV